MLPFLYSQFLKVFYPTSIAIVLLLVSAALRRRADKLQASGLSSHSSVLHSLGEGGQTPRSLLWSRITFWLALAVLFICGNGWVVGALTKHLERQHPSLAEQSVGSGQRSGLSQQPTLKSQPAELGSAPTPQPIADAILILSGGIVAKVPPRPTVEISEAGDRLLYGAHLFRQGRAPHIICTGKAATGSTVRRPVAEEMVVFLELIGLPTNAIITEVKSENTYQHGLQLAPAIKERGFKRILLVTSAMHMPRSMAVFQKQCPDIEFIPAPTDFRAVDRPSAPWYRHLTTLIPTPMNLVTFSEVMHEYLGLAYYRLRAWI